MTTEVREEKLVEQLVTYTLLKNDKVYIIENVPARVNQETGEHFFHLGLLNGCNRLS